MTDNTHKCDYKQFIKCENSSLCHLCDGVSLYKNSKEEFQAKLAQREANKERKKTELLKTYDKNKKGGMGFEKKVQNRWNNTTKAKKKQGKPNLFDELMGSDTQESKEPKPKSLYSPPSKPVSAELSGSQRLYGTAKKNEAVRQVNSGAFWHAKGDIKLEHALMECKERGTVNGRGEKTITIPKEWLDKQEKEAFQEGKPFWYVGFGYKNDSSIYIIKDFDHEIEMIHEIRRLNEELERLRQELHEKE